MNKNLHVVPCYHVLITNIFLKKTGIHSNIPLLQLRSLHKIIILKHITRSISFIFHASHDISCFRRLYRHETSPDPAMRIAISTNRRFHNHWDRKRDALCSTTVGSKGRQKHICGIYWRLNRPQDLTAPFAFPSNSQKNRSATASSITSNSKDNSTIGENRPNSSSTYLNPSMKNSPLLKITVHPLGDI